MITVIKLPKLTRQRASNHYSNPPEQVQAEPGRRAYFDDDEVKITLHISQYNTDTNHSTWKYW